MKQLFGVLITVFYGCPIFLHAQDSTVAVCGIRSEHCKIKNDSVNGRNNTMKAFLNFPVVKNKMIKAGGRLQYEYNNTREVSEYFNHQLNEISITAFWEKKRKNNKIRVFCRTGIYSDMNDITGKDFCFSIAGNYFVQHSARLSTGWGLGYSRQFFGHQLNPFIAIYYKINSRLRLSGLLPAHPKLTYTINKKISLTSEITGNVDSYRLSDSQFSNSFIHVSGWYALSNVEFTFRKHHQFTAGICYIFRQRMGYYEDSASVNWKLFTINLSEKSKPVTEITSSGIKIMIGYNLVVH